MDNLRDLRKQLRETIRLGKGATRPEQARMCKNLERSLRRKIAAFSRPKMPKRPFRIQRWDGDGWRYCTSLSTTESFDKARRISAEHWNCSVRVLDGSGDEVFSITGADGAVFKTDRKAERCIHGRAQDESCSECSEQKDCYQ